MGGSLNRQEEKEMSVHINAEKGQIADTVLLPGDPLRAKFIAETYLENVECYNEVRGMYGFTGTYNGKKYQFKAPAWVFRLSLFM